MKLSDYLKTYRTFNKLSLRAMADKCNCSFQYLSKLENDEVDNPSIEMLKKIADGTGTSVHEILSLVDDVEVNLMQDQELQKKIAVLHTELARLQAALHTGMPVEHMTRIAENRNEMRLLEYYRKLSSNQQTAILNMINSMTEKDGDE